MLPGFTEGQWWVQDAAAALPARLFGDVSGKTIADLCAAPGGKTAQLAQAGARVYRGRSLVRRAWPGCATISTRLALQADDVVADATEWPGRQRRRFRRRSDRCALHLDRHHPAPSRCGLAAAGSRYRSAGGVAEAIAQQGGRAAQAGRNTGLLHLLAGAGGRRAGDCRRFWPPNPPCGGRRSDAGEVAGLSEIITADGDLRTLPCHLPHADPRLGGLDGFYAARLVKS